MPIVVTSDNGTSVVLANSSLPTDNCVLGQTGRVCSWCLNGWTVQGAACAACPPDSSLASAGSGVVDSLISLVGAIGGIGFTLYLLLPLFPNVLERPARLIKAVRHFVKRMLRHVQERVQARARTMVQHSKSTATAETEEAPEKEGHKRKKASTITMLIALATFFVEPFRLIVDNVQIISSFQSTIHVSWVRTASSSPLSPP
jgi:hypothetical protein